MGINHLPDLTTWDFYSPITKKIETIDAPDMPFITYGSGRPCIEANLYLNSLLRNGLSIGTLKKYSGQIIHLVRFIESQPSLTSIIRLTDASFRFFVNNLTAERTKKGTVKRSNNTVIGIANQCLNFLKYVKYFHNLKCFIGEKQTNAIRVVERVVKVAIGGKQKYKYITVTTHSCVPSRDAKKRRLPVGAESAARAWDYIQNQDNRDKRLRDIALYQTMCQLGGRIGEIHELTVDDFKEAQRSKGHPSIKLKTFKRGKGRKHKARYIPVPRTLLRDIKQYIIIRDRIIRGRKINDHGYLFISLTTGEPLKAKSWTNFILSIRDKLNLSGDLHPHAFRHAYITNMLKEIILIHNEVNNEDDFRRYIINTEMFKLQLQQYSGHSSLESLDTYIHLAFSELSGTTNTYNAVMLKNSVGIFQKQIDGIKRQIDNKELNQKKALENISGVLSALMSDIDAGDQ
nr:site-specific integrase [Moritella viscosa]SHO03230.1 Site-specific recombinase, phage integrase family [Moritella viscosa]